MAGNDSRPTIVSKIAVLLALSIFVSACGENVGPSSGGALPSLPSTPRADRDAVEIYAAVIQRLVTKDHTFGSSATPFQHVYVVDGVVEQGGESEGWPWPS